MNTVIIIMAALTVLTSVISFLYKYRTAFTVLGFFTTRKFEPAKKNHKYAVMIAARNEEKVIGELLDSIKLQDYPSHLVTIFVVADNCDDRTAEIAREHGALCYERHDSEHRTKGFALQYLVEKIKEDYGINAFEGYFIFDADNLLKEDYISRMNDSFDSGEKIITSYRNTKNFGDNWIAASYGLHWLRTVRLEHRPRSFLRLATRIQGTGFLFAAELLKDGWNYTSLTEDRAFCADAVACGYTISYNNDAVFYDEQPTSARIAMRQRIRWARGHLEAFVETGPKLLFHVLSTDGVKDPYHTELERRNMTRGKRLLLDLRLRFMSFDMLTVVFPRGLYTTFKRILTIILRGIMICGGAYTVTLYVMPKEFRLIANYFGVGEIGGNAAFQIFLFTVFTLSWIVKTYLEGILTALYVFIAERSRISPLPHYKKVIYCLTFPIYDLVEKIVKIIALVKKVEWKPIPHNVSIGIDKVGKH